jgi:hypothetical protein
MSEGRQGDMPEKLYKHRIGRILRYDPWNDDAEPGDKMVDAEGNAYLLERSTGWGKRAAGELTPRRIKPPHPTAKAAIRNGQIWWVW